MSRFADFDLAKPILDAVEREGYDTPTPIQARAIPAALDGQDMFACAQTGTGKTAAFALPVLQQLFSGKRDMSHRGPAIPRALVLSPTRELANQIEDSFAVYGKRTGLTHTVVVGGVSQYHQVRRLRNGIDILVATPGRLQDLMEQGVVDISAVEIFVLDEADRMLDMGFIQPIRDIAKAVRPDRQTLLFSATMPKAILKLAASLLRDPVKIEIKPAAQTTALIEQSVHMVSKADKPAYIQQMLDDDTVERAVVFTRTKHGADKLTKKLSHAGITATAIHGNKAQRQRERALDSFRTGRSRVLVATDVAARGLDVDGITHVFNYDLPNEPETYVHRIGRTGRAGATGFAISLCDREERGYLRAIERLTGKRIHQEQTEQLSESRPNPAQREEREQREDRNDTREHRDGERTERPHHAERSENRPKRKPAHKAGGKHKPRSNAKRSAGGPRDENAEAKPKRKPRRRGGPGWGVEGGKEGAAQGKGKPRPPHTAASKKKRGAKRGPAKGPAGKPGSGVKRVRRSDLSGTP